jgi:hypothetical protein
VLNAPDISITLLEMNETLTKDLIFSRALSSLKEQYDEVCVVWSRNKTFHLVTALQVAFHVLKILCAEHCLYAFAICPGILGARGFNHPNQS